MLEEQVAVREERLVELGFAQAVEVGVVPWAGLVE